MLGRKLAGGGGKRNLIFFAQNGNKREDVFSRSGRETSEGWVGERGFFAWKLFAAEAGTTTFMTILFSRKHKHGEDIFFLSRG